MNAILLVIPLIVIRYGLPKLISNSANRRAGFFPPPAGIEKIMLNIYKITTMSLILLLAFFNIHFNKTYVHLGLGIYLIGLVLFILSIIDFARANENSVISKGVYRFSRNPMYVAFFLCFFGISLIINSWLYFLVLLIFQISVHFLILGEERWCCQEYGREYEDYCQRVRRYI